MYADIYKDVYCSILCFKIMDNNTNLNVLVDKWLGKLVHPYNGIKAIRKVHVDDLIQRHIHNFFKVEKNQVVSQYV